MFYLWCPVRCATYTYYCVRLQLKHSAALLATPLDYECYARRAGVLWCCNIDVSSRACGCVQIAASSAVPPRRFICPPLILATMSLGGAESIVCTKSVLRTVLEYNIYLRCRHLYDDALPLVRWLMFSRQNAIFCVFCHVFHSVLHFGYFFKHRKIVLHAACAFYKRHYGIGVTVSY